MPVLAQYGATAVSLGKGSTAHSRGPLPLRMLSGTFPGDRARVALLVAGRGSYANVRPILTANDTPRAAVLAPEEPPTRARIGVLNPALRDAGNLSGILDAERLVVEPKDSDAADLDYVVGWGHKPSSAAVREYSQRHGLPFWRLEDGFLRSVVLGVSGAPALSMIVDDLGVYYDSMQPSRLESVLASTSPGGPLDSPELLQRASSCIRRIVDAKLSKYNDSPLQMPPLPESPKGGRVLVVDQTRGDMSVLLGQVAEGGFRSMLKAALEEHPAAQIVVKTHPDVLAGKKDGYLTDVRHPRVHLLGAAINPISLLELVDHVYVATSQLGFEALMVGKPVTCFGVPFYAGWGLTDDRVRALRRGVPRSLEQVFAAAYLLATRYVDPDSGERAEIERVIEHLELQRALFARNTGKLFCFGFYSWKHGYVRQYLRSPGNEVLFVRTAGQAKRKGFNHESKLVAWGSRGAAATRELSDEYGVPIWRMEDGFLRSVGLGADRTTPASLVVDRTGLYYDPRTPSDLETILADSEFSPRELERAKRLRTEIVSREVSKYNIDGGDAVRAQARPGQRVVLVPGQVADDASVVLGSPVVRTNTDLLREVRQARPDAYIIFKPHPDVVSGNRRGAVHVDDVAACCDEVVVDAGIGRCLAVADEVHTMTSLVGFEALLREKEVVVYGQPFYAGWGLTDDRCPPSRRGRPRSIDELVAATLLRYPRYVNHETGEFTRPEHVIAEIERLRPAPGQVSLQRSWADKAARRVGKLVGTTTHFLRATWGSVRER